MKVGDTAILLEENQSGGREFGRPGEKIKVVEVAIGRCRIQLENGRVCYWPEHRIAEGMVVYKTIEHYFLGVVPRDRNRWGDVNKFQYGSLDAYRRSVRSYEANQDLKIVYKKKITFTYLDANDQERLNALGIEVVEANMGMAAGRIMMDPAAMNRNFDNNEWGLRLEPVPPAPPVDEDEFEPEEEDDHF